MLWGGGVDDDDLVLGPFDRLGRVGIDDEKVRFDRADGVGRRGSGKE